MTKLWNKIKSWSGWAEAGSIFMRRMETLMGVIMAGVASASAFNYIPFLTGSKIDWTILAPIAAYLFISGVVGEIVRRYKATDLA